jgi:hypothetical protein
VLDKALKLRRPRESRRRKTRRVRRKRRERKRRNKECRDRRYILQSETDIYWSAGPARPSDTSRLIASWSVGQ